MTRDYAKRSSQLRKNSLKNAKHRLRNWVVFLVILCLVGLFVGYKLNCFPFSKQKMKKLPPQMVTTKASQNITQETDKSSHDDGLKTANNDIVFNYYDLLKNEKLELSSDNNKEENDLNLYLRTAAFDNKKDADDLNNKLQLLSFETKVDFIYAEDGIVKYVITIGPYKDKESALLDQKNISQKIGLKTNLFRLITKS